jgi:hypothetical protein
VAADDVADFVGKHGGEFAFRFDHFKEASIDVNEAAREGDGVDIDGVGHFSDIGDIGAAALSPKFSEDAVDIIVEGGDGKDGEFLFERGGELAAESDFFGVGEVVVAGNHDFGFGCVERSREGKEGSARNHLIAVSQSGDVSRGIFIDAAFGVDEEP